MTTEAMKQAQHLLRWTHFGGCRTYQGPVPEAREVDKLLTEAIEEEESPKPTGWGDGLSQDYCKELGSWLANRPGARQQLLEMLSEKTQGEKQ